VVKPPYQLLDFRKNVILDIRILKGLTPCRILVGLAPVLVCSVVMKPLASRSWRKTVVATIRPHLGILVGLAPVLVCSVVKPLASRCIHPGLMGFGTGHHRFYCKHTVTVELTQGFVTVLTFDVAFKEA
jgi:uncharacterized membrane protein YuzA (DUF378 family)